MATLTKKARDTFFSQRFVNQVNDFSNSLYYKQVLQWLVKGVLGMLCYISNVYMRNFVMSRIIYFATVTTDAMV